MMGGGWCGGLLLIPECAVAVRGHQGRTQHHAVMDNLKPANDGWGGMGGMKEGRTVPGRAGQRGHKTLIRPFEQYKVRETC